MNNVKYRIGLLFVMLTFFGAAALFIRINKIDADTIVVPISDTLKSVDLPLLQIDKSNDDSLSSVIRNIIPEDDKTYGIVIINLRTHETFVHNEHQVFQSGSLYKLWVMATAYSQIKNKLFSEKTILQQEIPILNEKFHIATEDAELTEGTITRSVGDALSQMITISDNYAALLLSERVRLSNVAAFLKQSGFTESKIGTSGGLPTATASDIAKFFTSLYQGALVDQEYDEKMLQLLKQQKLNHKIPKNLPQDVMIAHKTGELGLFTHDAGIVYAPDNDYVIVILSETSKPSLAEQKIGEISESVYAYFTK